MMVPTPSFTDGSADWSSVVVPTVGEFAVGFVDFAGRLPEPLSSAAGNWGVAWAALLAIVSVGLLVRYRGYTERTTDRIRMAPVRSLLYGLVAGLVCSLVVGLLVLTIVGMLVAVPIVATILVLSVLGYLAVGRVLGAGWLVAASVAVVLAGAVGALIDVEPLLGIAAAVVFGGLGVGGALLDHVERTIRDDDPDGGGDGLPATSDTAATHEHADSSDATAGRDTAR